MNRRLPYGVAALFVGALVLFVADPRSDGEPPAPGSEITRTAGAYSPKKWEPAIAKFEEADRKTPPPPDGILFVGSSSIVKWTTLKADFPGLPIIQRGFGGSRIADSTFFAGRIVTPYRPKTIVFYAGDNDLAAGTTPVAVASDFKAFVARARRDLPPDTTRILFISLKPSPARWNIHAKAEETNRLIREAIAGEKGITFVDIWPLMLGTDGTPRPELFVKDGLHMTPAGYVIWRTALAPYLKP